LTLVASTRHGSSSRVNRTASSCDLRVGLGAAGYNRHPVLLQVILVLSQVLVRYLVVLKPIACTMLPLNILLQV
jgi:hypothetical protein